MKPFKIYLDTSVVLMYDDNSQQGIITKEFFKDVSKNNHHLVISEIVNTEITDNEAKRESNLSFLSTINYKLLPYSDESYNLAWDYVFDGVLTHNHFDDLLHIAYATIFECDVIVSWNRKHIAKPIKIQKINTCNLKNNYKMIAIYTPEEFLIYFK